MKHHASCLIVAILIGSASAMAWGQAAYSRNRIKDIVRNHPDQIGQLFDEALAGMRTHLDDADRFNRDKTFLINIGQTIQGASRSVDPVIANRAAEALIGIYQSRAQKFPDRGPFVVDFVARFGSSDKVQRFVLAALNGQPPGLREPATTALCWSQSLRGNQRIVSALAKNYKANKKDALSLAAMSRLDLEASRGTLKAEIAQAKDVRVFNEIAGIVSQTHDTDLMKALLLRVRDFRVTGRDEFTNPYIGFYSEAIASYIDSTEDADLEQMLAILPTVGAGYEERAALLEKLKNGKSPRSRKDIADAISGLAKHGILATSDIAGALENQSRVERDADAAAAMEAASKTIRARLKPVR